MVRTQVYLTVEEREALQAHARREGRSQSELIREAIRPLLVPPADPRARRAGMEQARGMWKDRDDLPDFAALRREWDRGMDAA